MSEQVTFKSFNPEAHSVYEVGDGVVHEMAQAFDHELAPRPNEENLGQLIGAIGPAKELQDNIDFVQEILGTDQDATGIARSWVERSGLLIPVSRSFMHAERTPGFDDITGALITGGVRNWMHRRAEHLLEFNGGTPDTLLVAGNREMREAEGDDVEPGMTEADYMDSVIRDLLETAGVQVELIRVDSSVGDEVMDAAAKGVSRRDRMLVVSNAGAWVQNVGQFRRALRRTYPEADQTGEQVYTVSDGFSLGTGKEPTATHQNPFSALGQVARNTQELTRHQ